MATSTTSANSASANTPSLAALAASPLSLDFGDVHVGSSSTLSLTLTNSGTAALTVSRATVTGTGFSISAPAPLPLPLAAGQSAILSASFAPAAMGSTSGSISVLSNASGSPLTIALTGIGAAVAPSIVTQPVNQSIIAGQTATFSVVAAGGPLNYQWQKNGTAINGATSASYTTPPTVTSDNGALFTVTVSNSSGVVTSNAATLTVTTGPVSPSITTQPANQTVTVGKIATFSVVAAGTAPLSYQWQKNGSPISGATQASYTTPATTSADNGTQFVVVVSNSVGSVTSNAATLTVNAAPGFSITSQPPSQTVMAGSSASYTLTVTPQGGFNGTVSFSAAGLPSGATAIFTPASLNGVVSSTVTVFTGASASAGSYTLRLTGTSGSLTNSALVNLTINGTGLQYYVSPSASDSKPGTFASPWATIQHAAQSITGNSNGVIVHVAPGSYTGSVTVSLSGTASGPVEFVSDVQWGAKLDGQGADYAWNMTGDYQEVIGFEITNAARQGVNATGSHTRVLGAKIHDIALNTPCDGGGADAWGQDTYNSSDAEISNSVIYNIGPGSPTGARCNTIHGIYFAIPTGRALNNLISMVTGDCITSWHYATNLTIANNTVMGCPDAGILIGADSTTMDNTVVSDNIILHSPIGIAEEGNLGTHNLYLNNLLYDVPTPLKWVTGSASGTILSNPLVVNDTGTVSTGDYHLQLGSPTIDQGTNQYCPGTDFAGYPRPYGSSCDIGAYEWHP